MGLVILMVKNYWNVLWKELQKIHWADFRVEKVIRRKGNKQYVKWKSYDNSFLVRLMRKMLLYKMSQHFPKPYERFSR